MTPEISEFSYGFAITNEIVGWMPVTAAPIFPSLIEEGKEGGGYDVMLDAPGVPLYIQFKRSDCMKRKSAAEIKEHKLDFEPPFYRFKITESGKSDQHQMLVDLDDGKNSVFYAAPRFHRLREINDAWLNDRVSARSIFVSPREIGELDNKSHHVAFDHEKAFLCSEPRSINFLTSGDLAKHLEEQLAVDARPIRSKIPDLLEGVISARNRAIEKILARRRRDQQQKSVEDEESIAYRIQTVPLLRTSETDATVPIDAVPIRRRRGLDGLENNLRDLSDAASRLFNLQLIIVQPRRR